MNSYIVPELSQEEKKLSIVKFYEKYPLYKPDPLRQQILNHGPMKSDKAITAENWLNLLQTDSTPEIVYGYCMMPDGSGYYIEYSITPSTMKGGMRQWYGKWYNQRPKSVPEKYGNLRYKLWNPLDHWDHHFVNGVDDKDGVWSLETLDMGKSGGGKYGVPAISHNIELAEYGLTKEKAAKLKEAGCRVSACWEEFEGPGHHLVLRFSRPSVYGGMENLNCEWIGYWANNGKIIRDENTSVDETYLKNVLVHNTVERIHLSQILPDLYEEYHDKSLDDD